MVKIRKYIRERITKKRMFKVLFGDDATLQYVIKCRDCGTVVVSYNDEGYEHKLSCPTCTNYVTKFKYFTKKEIRKDKDLATYLRVCEKIHRECYGG